MDGAILWIHCTFSAYIINNVSTVTLDKFLCIYKSALVVTVSCNHHRADFRLAPSQWGTSLQSNAVSHWLDANLKSALHYILMGPSRRLIDTLTFRWLQVFWTPNTHTCLYGQCKFLQMLFVLEAYGKKQSNKNIAYYYSAILQTDGIGLQYVAGKHITGFYVRNVCSQHLQWVWILIQTQSALRLLLDVSTSRRYFLMATTCMIRLHTDIDSQWRYQLKH